MTIIKIMNIQELLSLTVDQNASDLHLVVGFPPSIRIDGSLLPIPQYKEISPEEMEAMAFSLLTPPQKEAFIANKELDFSLGFGGGVYGDAGRFRVNAYYQRGYIALDFRFLPPHIRTIEELALPKVCHSFAALKQGFILVTGPTGHGKSTTLAAIINEINISRASHILTIEDPIEYIYPKGKSMVSQREMGIDTHSWTKALRAALREDPDVVLVGEMRDPETMEAAFTVAETGHLVFSTLHTNSASQSIDRIVGSFPPHQQPQIRMQLASTLKGIISQRLIPQVTKGRIAAVEILIGTNAVSANIRDGKTHLIDSVIQTSADIGMIPLEASLASLVTAGQVSLDTAKSYALHEEEFLQMLK